MTRVAMKRLPLMASRGSRKLVDKIIKFIQIVFCLFRALSAGAKTLVVFIDVESKIRNNPSYEQAELVSVLGALRALYKVTFIV